MSLFLFTIIFFGIIESKALKRASTKATLLNIERNVQNITQKV